MWPEVKIAKEEKRHELVLHGADIGKRIDQDGLDSTIFSITTLNFLEISNSNLKELSSEISNLVNITSLVLHSNSLKTIPSSINSLSKLKFLDLARNDLTLLPDEITELTQVETLNVSCNKLSEFPDMKTMVRLHIFDISHNELESMPEGIAHPALSMLSTISVAANQIRELPTDLSELPSLKKLDVSDNKIEVIPPETSECVKLKEFNFRGNKLKDRRLGKMMDQCSTKAVLDYLRNLLQKQREQEGKGKGKKVKGKKGRKMEKEIEDLSQNVMHVLKFPEDNGFIIQAMNTVADVRPFIVCCVVRDLDLQKSSNMFKRFITLQTRLHDGICQKRQAATIATHDLAAIKPPLRYNAKRPQLISLVPLFKQKPVSADKLVDKLRQEAEEVRKEKKRNTLSGIHKYLDLLKNKPVYPILEDCEGTVLSFPPITNCEVTKVSKETTDILVEVTSSSSLDTCKKVMDELLQNLLEIGVGRTESDKETATGGDLEASLTRNQQLSLEQVRVTDEEHNMKVIYPARPDLLSTAYKVVRSWEH